MTINEQKPRVRQQLVPERQEKRCSRIFPTPQRSVRSIGNQLAGPLRFSRSRIKVEGFVYIKVGLPAIVQKLLMEFIEVNVFKIAPRIGRIASQKIFADIERPRFAEDC